jgi:hypothetical protein
LSAYATAFRYSLKPAPDVEQLRAMLEIIQRLLPVAEEELAQ